MFICLCGCGGFNFGKSEIFRYMFSDFRSGCDNNEYSVFLVHVEAAKGNNQPKSRRSDSHGIFVVVVDGPNRFRTGFNFATSGMIPAVRSENVKNECNFSFLLLFTIVDYVGAFMVTYLFVFLVLYSSIAANIISSFFMGNGCSYFTRAGSVNTMFLYRYNVIFNMNEEAFVSLPTTLGPGNRSSHDMREVLLGRANSCAKHSSRPHSLYHSFSITVRCCCCKWYADCSHYVVLAVHDMQPLGAEMRAERRLKELASSGKCEEHFDEEKRGILPLTEATGSRQVQQEKLLEQSLDVMPGTHSHLLKFFMECLQHQEGKPDSRTKPPTTDGAATMTAAALIQR
ncbi:hemerythrin-like protein [Artemisia annua]|uniref:Hemerythrin-like protein n=1 Tax=Artemisia annua TaxID=35608 RepID=A0A2U1QDS4_ARTAN|nr:hemerythrin-like protein [Artemisia annua]